MTTLYERLIAFQAEQQPITKNSVNKNYKHAYATLDIIQESIQPLLAKHGLGYYFQPIEEGVKMVLFDIDGNTIDFIYPTKFTGSPQEVGSAITYAKRYALCAMLGLIIAEEDDDGQKAQEAYENNRVTNKIQNNNLKEVTEEQVNQIINLLKNPDTKNKGYAYFKQITNKTKINQELYEKLVETVQEVFKK